MGRLYKNAEEVIIFLDGTPLIRTLQIDEDAVGGAEFEGFDDVNAIFGNTTQINRHC